MTFFVNTYIKYNPCFNLFTNNIINKKSESFSTGYAIVALTHSYYY